MALEPPLTRTTSFQTPSNFSNNSIHDRNDQAHWSTYSFVQLLISHLPPGVTTLDIYNNFRRYGNVSKIVIWDHRQGDIGTRADLYFDPPPQYPIWERTRVNFIAANGFTKHVHLKLSAKQPRSFAVQSPVQHGVAYNEKTELLASSLSWGVLTEPKTMMKMATTVESEDSVRLVLNLKRREIEVFFPLTFQSQTRVAVRSFRFIVALDENFIIWRLPGKRYVLHLASIPWYSKQLKEAISQTHSGDAKRWSEEDTWARQTDIFEHKNNFELISKTPISLQKNLNSVNIARWTTFEINLLDSEDNKTAERVFRNALRDFNVSVCKGTNFKTVEGGPQLDIQAWTLLNGKRKSNQPLSLVEELAECRLPFSVRYQLEVCLSHGWLSEYQMTSGFLQALASTGEREAVQMLIYVDSYQQRVWNPMEIFKDLRYRRPVKQRPIPEHCIEVRSATVTATSILWNSPTVEITNRVIRRHKQYADHFLRVRFEDDEYRGKSRLYAATNNKMILIFQRVKRALLHGIRLGDRHYEFLAWGNSQLRDHGVYFFARNDVLTASNIRAEMGEFSQEKVVAKRAARMGQCFSTTKPVHLRLRTITPKDTIPDIYNGKYTFTDGVGKISSLAAQLIHTQLKIKGPVPSLFQFRLGGCKGVLTVWPELVGVDVQVRASQFKFDSTSGNLEIIRWSEFWQPFLNRQIIICLSDLGVPDGVFLKKQEETIKALDAAMKDDKAATKALRDNVDPNMMTMSVANLVEAGFRASKEPFVTSVLYLWKAWSLKYLKEKAKIPVPKGAFVFGCVDETNTLRGHFEKLVPHPGASFAERMKTLPEIFIQVTDPQTNQRKVIEGICILARNPSLHRGDIRVVKAVNVSNLRHLCDVVVMPANGDRDLPSMCSGGDLDGDDYMVIWDQELIPETWNAEPFHYNPPPPKTAVGEITTEDIINFYYDYLQNDYLGRIAHAHLGAADYLDEGIESPVCLELVHLHSMAVDYPKTGVPAIMERRLERSVWPHFMEKRGPSYKSHKVLGKLYDAVERISFNPTHGLPFDRRLLNVCQPNQDVLESIKDLKQDYDNALQRIMAQHSIGTEFEVWSTFVLDHSKASRDFKFHEEIGQLSSALKEQYYEALCGLAGGTDFEHLAPIAITAYQYTCAMVQTAMNEIEQGLRYGGSSGMPFISFPWILQETLCKIAKQADDSIVIPGSTAVIRNGSLIKVDHDTKFDDEGRAQIQLQDALDVEIGLPSTFSGHLPDPYQPQTDVARGGNDTVKPLFERDLELRKTSPHQADNAIMNVKVTGNEVDVRAILDQQDHGQPPVETSNGNMNAAPSPLMIAPRRGCNDIHVKSHEDTTYQSSTHYAFEKPPQVINNNGQLHIESLVTGSSSQYEPLPTSSPSSEREAQPSKDYPVHGGYGQEAHTHGGETEVLPTMFDPLTMTAEQIEAMGLCDDMEL